MTALAAVPDRPLDRLAREVRAEHEAVQAQARGMLAHAIAAGAALIEAKEQIQHGSFLPWLATTGLSVRQAQKYMRLAKSVPGAHLPDDATINDALDVLAGKRKPPPQPSEKAQWQKLASMGAPPRISDSEAIRRYSDLMTENPDWAWKRVGAHLREFVEVVKDMPPVPAKANAAKELREAIVQLERLLGDNPRPVRNRRRKAKPPEDPIK